MSEGEQHRNVEQRTKDLDRREAALEARLRWRTRSSRPPMDADADARDVVAATRDHEADREAFLGSESGYGEDLPVRRHAAQDRVHAKVDRTRSADNRARLTLDVEEPEKVQS